jgi:serine/threonine protein kinase
VASEFGPLEDLADAVLLGNPVDWASAESSAGAGNREAVRQLKILARIAELHRNLAYDIPSAAPPKLERWGRLELLERIGRGSFGEVYRAWDSKLDREVAVKLLHADGGQSEDATVLREARLLARVRHPNVVTVYDADEIDGRVGLWMEFIHGRDLEQILGERKRFDDRDVTRTGIEVCRALAAVHDAGLLHRDIKAQNVMQTADGRLVLMDFGTGRELDQTPSADVDTAGTPLYLAPELFDGGAATVRSDVYSAGVLLFHLLTGAYPVRGATVKEVHDAHTRGERIDLAAKAPGANKTLATAISRAIDADPSRRFPTSREMLAALDNVQRRTEARKRTRYSLVFAAAAVAAIAAGTIPGLRRRNSDGSDAPRAAYVGVTPEKRVVQTPPLLIAGRPSPDGRYLPYSEASTGNLALYEFATGESRALTKDGDGGDNYATGSIVSVDNSRVAYTWVDGSWERVQLRVIDTAGGAPRTLYGAPNARAIELVEWSRDGKEILGTRQRSGGETELLLISAADGSESLVTTFPYGPDGVALSRDGQYVAYGRGEDPDGKDGGIFLTTRDGKREIPIVTGPTYDSKPMWTPDGSGLLFTSFRTGGPALWLQRITDARADGEPRLLEKDMGPFDPITLTLTGSFFYLQRTGLMDVYTAPIDPTTGDLRGEPMNAAEAHHGSNLAGDWSPDGNTLVFASWRTGFGPGRNILVFHSMDTGKNTELQLDVAFANNPRWSPDGSLIAVGGADRKGVNALRFIDSKTGKIVRTLCATTGDAPACRGFVWSRDGRSMYFRRNSGDGVYRFDIDTGAEEELDNPPPESQLGRLSPDRAWLLSTTHSQAEKLTRLIVTPAGGGKSRELARVEEPDALLLGDWTPDGKHILFVRRSRDSEQKHQGEIWTVPFDGGPARSVGLKRPALRDLRVSPIGDSISFTVGYPDREIWVFENFLPNS